MCGGDFNAPARIGAMLSNSARIVGLAGRAAKKWKAAFRADVDIEDRMVSGLNESERAEVVRLLRKLTQAMQGLGICRGC
jgi:DNA-binding MarR family transcriptional regulator